MWRVHLRAQHAEPPATGRRFVPPFATMSRKGERLVVAAGLVWLDRARVLLQRRAATASHGAGLLELPGGKVELGEAPTTALARELEEEWGHAARALVIGPVVDVLHHVYPPPGPEVLLCVYHVDAGAWSDGGDAWRRHITPQPGVEVHAYAVHELPLSEFLDADRPFATALARGQIPPWPQN